jgi:hypothetical protein
MKTISNGLKIIMNGKKTQTQLALKGQLLVSGKDQKAPLFRAEPALE